jgi:hypothetical protein
MSAVVLVWLVSKQTCCEVAAGASKLWACKRLLVASCLLVANTLSAARSRAPSRYSQVHTSQDLLLLLQPITDGSTDQRVAAVTAVSAAACCSVHNPQNLGPQSPLGGRHVMLQLMLLLLLLFHSVHGPRDL